MTKKLYIVESVSSFHVKYVVYSDEEPKKAHLQALIDDGELVEYIQEFLGEKLSGVALASPKEQSLINQEKEKINELDEQIEVEMDGGPKVTYGENVFFGVPEEDDEETPNPTMHPLIQRDEKERK